MKFTVERITTLHGYNADGSKVAISEGDEVYLKIDLASMNFWDKEKYMQEYPDGWVRGIIHRISKAGKRIWFELFNDRTHFFILNQSDILAVSDKAPKEVT